MGNHLLHILSRPLTPLYEFLYPPTCSVCNRLLPNRTSLVCRSCWTEITEADFGTALFRQAYHRLCTEGHGDGLVSAFVFEDRTPIHEIVHQLKYREGTRLGTELGWRLGSRIREEVELRSVAGIIPVPLHRTKKRERGYNQSELIASGIASVLSLPLQTEILHRRRFTSSQTHLSAKERRKNVGGAFSIRTRAASLVYRRRYLIVDDVITTGATIEECARVLCSSGALRPIVCSVALAP